MGLWGNFFDLIFVKNAEDFELVQVLGLWVWKTLRWNCLSDSQEATGLASPQPLVLICCARALCVCCPSRPPELFQSTVYIFYFFKSKSLFENGLDCWT